MAQPSQSLAPMQGAALVLASVGLTLASFMQILDQTIANVSIPTIAGNLGVSPDQGTWVITSFGVSSAISLPLTGWLAQRFGQVRLFIGTTLMFVLASLLCGLATSHEMLVGARVLQGLVAGPVMPLSQAMLIGIFPADRRLTALSIWSTVTIVAPIFGPILGGYISDNWGWPWIFFINVPIGLFAALLTREMFRGRETATHQAPIDITGLVLLAIWVGALQIVLDTGTHEDWFNSKSIVILSVVSLLTFCYFVIWELTAEHPVVDLRMFKRRNFTVGATASSLGYSIFFGTAVVVPLWLQTQMGYTAALAGLAAAPIGLFPLVLSRAVNKGLQQIDPRWFATGAFLAFSLASFMRADFSTAVDFETVVIAQLVMGFGIAMFMVPLQSVTLSGLTPDQIPSASGLSNFARVTAGSFGASIATTLWTHRDAVHRTSLAESVSMWDAADRAQLSALQAQGLSPEQAAAVLEGLMAQQTSTLGTNDYYWICGWVLLALIAVVWFARPPFVAGRKPAPVE